MAAEVGRDDVRMDGEPLGDAAPAVGEIREPVDEDVGEVAGAVPLERVRVEARGEREPAGLQGAASRWNRRPPIVVT